MEPPRITFRRYDPDTDEASLVALLLGEHWEHRLQPRLTEADVRRELEQGEYAGEGVVTELIEVDGEVAGFVRAFDLGRERSDPQLDFRLAARFRGRGVGLAALRHITGLVFSAYPATQRIEGQTRQDNVAMRRVFARGGYVREAVYREAWPAPVPGAPDRVLDGIGYAILRRDWETGITTPVDWSEP